MTLTEQKQILLAQVVHILLEQKQIHLVLLVPRAISLKVILHMVVVLMVMAIIQAVKIPAV